jgi:hypothetical protein
MLVVALLIFRFRQQIWNGFLRLRFAHFADFLFFTYASPTVIHADPANQRHTRFQAVWRA